MRTGRDVAYNDEIVRGSTSPPRCAPSRSPPPKNKNHQKKEGNKHDLQRHPGRDLHSSDSTPTVEAALAPCSVAHITPRRS